MVRLPVAPALLSLTFGSGLYIIYTIFKVLGVSSLKELTTLPLFTYHPLFMVLAWLFFAPISWSIVLMRKTTLKATKRALLTQLHAASMFLAVVCWLIGIYAIFTNKQKQGRDHFTSPHSWVGGLFFALVVASYASAFSNVIDLKSREKVHFNWSSKVHKYLGKTALVTSGLAIGTGLYSRWGKSTFISEPIRAGLALAIIIPHLLVALDVTALFAGSGGGKGGKAESPVDDGGKKKAVGKRK